MRLIDADALTEMYCAIHCPDYELCNLPDNPCDAIDIIACQPTIDPVKHGCWIPFHVSGVCAPEYQPVKCSLCGTNYGHYMWQEYLKYCPNCGAMMEDESNATD